LFAKQIFSTDTPGQASNRCYGYATRRSGCMTLLCSDVLCFFVMQSCHGC